MLILAFNSHKWAPGFTGMVGLATKIRIFFFLNFETLEIKDF